MKHLRRSQFKSYSRMSGDFLRHFDCLLDLIKLKIQILKGYDKHGEHKKGDAVHFRIVSKVGIYPQTINVLNACNEYFRNRKHLRFRLGVYPEEKCFHLDTVQKKLFWIAKYQRDEYGNKKNQLEYKFYRDNISFLNDLFDGV